MHRPAVTRQQPLEAIRSKLVERCSKLNPGVPASILEGDEILLAIAPRKRVAGKEHVLVEQVDHAAEGVSGHRDRRGAARYRAWGPPFKQVSRKGRGRLVVPMNPDACGKGVGVFVRICDIVTV